MKDAVACGRVKRGERFVKNEKRRRACWNRSQSAGDRQTGAFAAAELRRMLSGLSPRDTYQIEKLIYASGTISGHALDEKGLLQNFECGETGIEARAGILHDQLHLT